MADYVSILTRAISAHGESNEETRRKIYEKARKALTRQLSSLEPPLSAEDISKQLLPLEEAIREIEGGYADISVADDINSAEPPVVETTPPAPAPEPQVEVEPEAVAAPAPPVMQEPEVSPTPAVEPEPPVIVEPEVSVNPTPAPSPAPQPEAAPSSIPQAETVLDKPVAPAPVITPEPQPEIIPQVEPASMPVSAPEPMVTTPLSDEEDAPVISQEPSPAIPSVEPTPQVQPTEQLMHTAPEPLVAPVAPAMEEAQPTPEPALATPHESLSSPEKKEEQPTLDEAAEALEAVGMPAPTIVSPTAAPAPAPDADQTVIDAETTEPQPADLTGFGDIAAKQDAEFSEHDTASKFEPKKRKGIAYALVGTVVLLILVGTGAVAWLQRDNLSQLVSQIGDLTNSFSSDQSAANNNAPNTPSPAPNTVEKNEDRLLNTPLDLSENDSAPDATQPRDVTPLARAELPDSEVQTPAVVSPVVIEPTAEPTPAPTTPTVSKPDPVIAETPLVETTRAEEPPAAPAAPAVNLFGASAILYEEVSTGSGQTNVSNGSILWELVPNGSEAIGANGLPSVRGAITVQSRDLRVRFEILRNLDASLPASHLIELEFTGGPLFNDDAINNITAVVLKPSEQQKGRALAGAVAKVSDNVFWLAMSNSAADLAANTDALKQQNWIDIPVIFQSGKRAILTLEKGAAGKKAIEKAFEDWAK